MEAFENILSTIDTFVWGPPLIALILLGGIFLTIRLRALQFPWLPRALRYTFSNEKGAEGEITSFAAMCTAMSATVGTGNIVGISVKVGDTVKAGQQVAVLEAMKMENTIESPVAGTVTAVHVAVGDSVPADAPIVTIG